MSQADWPTHAVTNLAWAFALSALLAALVSPWGRRLAWIVGAIDIPNPRKTHQHATPRLGGLSAALALLTCVLIWIAVDPSARDQCAQYWGLLPGATLMFLIGLYDDLFDVKPPVKLAFQIIAAGIICVGGIRIDVLILPGIGQMPLGWLAPIITVLWIVGVTNALNLLDGLDGLTAGTAALASSSFLLIADYAALGSMLGLLSAVLVGACAVLVVNNLRPPKLFLGDSGSLLLGVMVASMSILAGRFTPAGASTDAHGVRLLVPLIALAVPILDMLACIIRRILTGRSIFAADRGHIHHLLLARGMKPPAVVATLCAATGLAGIIAAVAAHAPVAAEPFALAAVLGVALLVYRKLGYLAPRTWSRVRRTRRIILHLVDEVTRRAAEHRNDNPTSALIDRLLTCIIMATHLLGIDYIAIHVNGPRSLRQRGLPNNLLERGRRPARVHEISFCGPDGPESGELLVTLGESANKSPIETHANQLLLVPLLDALSRATGIQREPATRRAPPLRPEKSAPQNAGAGPQQRRSIVSLAQAP